MRGRPPLLDVAVLGAGLTGVCTALELARHGLSVGLVDQDPQPLNRASLRNEGKIHLGLTYANDPSFLTAALQLRGALTFRRILARLIGPEAGELNPSTPFVYLVARDSLRAPSELEEHYARLDAAYRTSLAEEPGLDYLGTRPERLYEPCSLSGLAVFAKPEAVRAAFRTAELAIDTHLLATILRRSVFSSPHVRFLPGRRVRSVERKHGLFLIEGETSDGVWGLEASQVVNALWENRLSLDHQLGLPYDPGWLYRLKYRVIVRLPPRLRGRPSATMVLGRYGDVVIRPDVTAYLSWYPAGLRGWSHDLTPPIGWDAACRGLPAEAEAQSVAADTLKAIDAWYPGIGDSTPLVVDAGIIVAHGETDVDDARSALHERTRVGVTTVDGYHSVNPGKLTTAPLFAQMAAESVMSCLISMRA